MEKTVLVYEIISRLLKLYPNPKTALHYSNPLELLVATILSAQATDKLVNQVTPELFKKYKNAQDYADAPLEELQKDISRINFYRNKAKAIKAASQIIVEKFRGEVPRTMEELDSLPGIARKSANVIQGNAFGIAEGIVVDTHVTRVSQRLSLTAQKDPVKIEQDLMKIVPKEKWLDFAHLLIDHGRATCKAPKPHCPECVLKDICPSAKKFYPDLELNGTPERI